MEWFAKKIWNWMPRKVVILVATMIVAAIEAKWPGFPIPQEYIFGAGGLLQFFHTLTDVSHNLGKGKE